jgi:hypothetical protein
MRDGSSQYPGRDSDSWSYFPKTAHTAPEVKRDPGPIPDTSGDHRERESLAARISRVERNLAGGHCTAEKAAYELRKLITEEAAAAQHYLSEAERTVEETNRRRSVLEDALQAEHGDVPRQISELQAQYAVLQSENAHLQHISQELWQRTGTRGRQSSAQAPWYEGTGCVIAITFIIMCTMIASLLAYAHQP